MPRKETKPDPQNQLRIKARACERLIKEAAYYEQELVENETQLQKMKDDKRDPYDIKKFEEVVGESRMMIPDSICRRDKALVDLNEFVNRLEMEGEVTGDFEWMVKAKEMLKENGFGGKASSGDGGEGGKEGDVAVTEVDDLAEGEAF